MKLQICVHEDSKPFRGMGVGTKWVLLLPARGGLGATPNENGSLLLWLLQPALRLLLALLKLLVFLFESVDPSYPPAYARRRPSC